MPKCICNSHFGNGICHGAFYITEWGFPNDYYRINHIGQWGNILVPVMGFADTIRRYVLGDSGKNPVKGSTASGSYDGNSREHTKVFSEHIFPVTTYDFGVKLIDPMPFELKTSEGTYENIPDMQSKAATVICYTKPSKLKGKVQS